MKGTQKRIVLGVLSLLVPVFVAHPAQAETGGAIFKSKCVLCHAADGSGDTPMGKQLKAANLRSKDVQMKTDAQLRKSVRDGSVNMPPFAEQLSNEEISRVIKYVRSLAGQVKNSKATQ